MLSLIVLYSPDRRSQLDVTISCLRAMQGYESCQKILVVDGKLVGHYPEFEVCEVVRNGPYFNWSRSWGAGLARCQFDTVWYLESDRILPPNYISLIAQNIKPRSVLYSQYLFKLKHNVDFAIAKKLRDLSQAWGPVVPKRFSRQAMLDRRLPHPPDPNFLHYGKASFSGNAAFLRSTLNEIGGVDERYEGAGLFDTDLHYAACARGVLLVKLPATELHQNHTYSIRSDEFILINIWNALLFCKKWGTLPGDEITALMKQSSISQTFFDRSMNMGDFLNKALHRNLRML